MKRFNYAWIILICCCLSQGAAIGIGYNCGGLFNVPVSIEFGCPVSQVALYQTINSLASCAAMLLITKRLVTRVPLKIVLPVSSLFFSLRIILGFSTAIWQWWVIAVFTGTASSVLFGYATSITLERWFARKLPTALSVVATFSGVFGIGMSRVIGILIANYGWRTAMIASSLVMLVLTVIPGLFLALNPSEMGKLPYGADEEEYAVLRQKLNSAGASSRIPFDRLFIVVALISLISAMLTAYLQHLSALGTSIGVTMFDVSLLVTGYMVGNMLFKTVFPLAESKFGLLGASVIYLSFTVAGLGLMLSGRDIPTLIGSFFFGASAVLYSTQIPLVEHRLYSSADYPAAVQTGMVVCYVANAFFCYFYGLMYDRTGSYSIPLVILIVATLLNIAVLAAVLGKKRNSVKEGC